MRHERKVVFAALALFCGLVSFIYFPADQAPPQTVYGKLSDLSGAYAADAEIIAAKQAFAKAVPTQVIVDDRSGKKQVALTIDGMADAKTMQKALDLLEKYHLKATFFIEGINAAAEAETAAAIVKRGQKIGNYTYVGVARAHTLPADAMIQEFCRTQKVLRSVAGEAPKLFKCDRTAYEEPVLKAAAASGLESAVKTTAYAPAARLGSLEQANVFVAGLKPGSIVSIRLGRTVEAKPKSEEKAGEKPAVDKQPSLKDGASAGGAPQGSAVEGLERLLIALALQKYDTAFVEDFRKIQYVPAQTAAKQAALEAGRPGGWLAWAGQRFTELFSVRAAEAAPAQGAAGWTKLRAQNEGRLAEEMKMVFTTQPAVPFTFTGLSREASVRDILKRLDAMGAKATFFVFELEMRRQKQLIRDILAAGHEVGLAIYPKAGASFAEVCDEITRGRSLLTQEFGVRNLLVKQPWGAVAAETKEAVSALGLKLIGQRVNVVQGRHKGFNSAEAVISQIFGASVHSVGRGWIVNFRMDYYTQPFLIGEVMDLLKKNKIDNIAYRSFDDNPETNPGNDSAYAILPVGEMLNQRAFTYVYPVPRENVPRRLRYENNVVMEEGLDFVSMLSKRYIGFEWVNEDDRMWGFSKREMRSMDLSGRIHANKPVVFFTFDDWGTDAAINQLLYVLRKHKVPAAFFVLTHNVLDNPNLLRAIAAEGHDIGSHTDLHKPMATYDKKGRQIAGEQDRLQYREDVLTSYRKLESVAGDVMTGGRPSLTRFFRAPTLAVSKMGVEEIFAGGYEYIVAGSTSTEDYNASSLYEMIERIKAGLYLKGEVKTGAVFVMHMSDNARFTPKALDAILTANELRPEGDPAKFVVGRLSDYLVDGYDQSSAKKSLELARSRGR